MEKKTYSFLDGFRGIGILMIIIHHMCVGFDLFHIFQNDPPVLLWIFEKAWGLFHVDLSGFYLMIQHVINYFKGILGVQIFLIISGFLITRKLLHEAKDLKGVLRFWVWRFFRIYPAYALMVMVSLLVFTYQQPMLANEFIPTAVRHLLFFQNYFPSNIYLEHAWTLGVFEQFYFVLPVLIFSVLSYVKTENKQRVVLTVVFLVIMGVGAWAKYSLIVQGKPLFSGPLKAPHPYFTLTYHLGSLGVGCLSALLEPYWCRLFFNKMIALVLWCLGIAGYCVLLFMIDWGYHWGPWYLSIIGYVSTLALFAAAYNGVSVLTKLHFLQWLGRNAYGIYLWHILAIVFLAHWIGRIPPTLLIVITLVTCIGAGYLSTATIERFFLRFRERV